MKIKELKTKVQHLDALVLQRDKEIIDWKKKWEKRDLIDDKYTIKSKV
jgi:hypothetical protein